jgi:plasmid segregation protein ParM
MHLPFIGIDVGRSAVKAIARQGSRTFSVMFPSAVCIAQAVPFEEIAAAAAVDSVELDGQTYWTGETALTQQWGGEAIGRNDDWVMGLQHDVLVAAALKRLRADGLEYDGSGVVNLGLPSRVFTGRRDLAEGIVGNARRILSGHRTPDVYVHAQPMGVIACHTLEPDGYMREGVSLEDGSFAVIEIGQFTTDFTAVLKGEPIIHATASCEGVELIINHLRGQLRLEGVQLPHSDVERLIAGGSIRVRGKDLDIRPMLDEAITKVFVPRIIDNAKRTLSPALLQSADSVLVAGGGGTLAMPGLARNPMFSHAVLVANPRMAVADGFARLSAMVHALSQTDPAAA